MTTLSTITARSHDHRVGRTATGYRCRTHPVARAPLPGRRHGARGPMQGPHHDRQGRQRTYAGMPAAADARLRPQCFGSANPIVRRGDHPTRPGRSRCRRCTRPLHTGENTNAIALTIGPEDRFWGNRLAGRAGVELVNAVATRLRPGGSQESARLHDLLRKRGWLKSRLDPIQIRRPARFARRIQPRVLRELRGAGMGGSSRTGCRRIRTSAASSPVALFFHPGLGSLPQINFAERLQRCPTR